MAIMIVMALIAIPSTVDAWNRYRLDGAVRSVAVQVRSARLTAVTNNRTMRLRFNCPNAGVFRAVEITGNAAIDNAGNRCAFAFPDNDPVNPPNSDLGPAYLPNGITFAAVQDLLITPRGQVTAVTGNMPAAISVTNGNETRILTVSTAGLVQMP